MIEKHIAVGEILLDIEKELRDLRLWEFESPSEAALASTEPFAVDTLNFPQWLQFIFLPRLHYMVRERLQLPTRCDVAPMAEQYFSEVNLNSNAIIMHIKKIDVLLTDK
jgi:uncharacterized protein YqcC (DUF446 family)